ncbi:hypothetical protein HR060_08690 [Catenovulum sp. SM1970]|uniref:DcaP family trimeric outer membrane transporter n=1 Tax=Marinifaba aquimaris TaxID=2741323 RepID=UPI0015728A3F|nr:DcaP family trimeric outer membrane transporter [Marinifaba aquimaris]NTS76947.1 hypothetical protein [Marinifaba aquimaris]
MFNKNKILLASGLLALAGSANAAYEFKLSDKDKISFGGYIKADARYVDGNIKATDYWYGGGTVLEEDKSNFGMSVNESRFNMKYTHDDVVGFIEMDFFGDAVKGGGNEIISNSSNPRLRHAFVKYKDVLAGQTWSTFVNTSAIPEAADFAGPLNSIAFIRQGQVRYTMGGFQVAIENPESYGGETGNDGLPDFIARYNFKGDWGNISVSGVARQLNTLGGEEETAIGYGIAGKINAWGKDDFKFQVHAGEVGRYVGVTASKDLIGEEVEETTSIMVAYRHFWTEDVRSTFFYGNTETDVADYDRTHWGVNVFKNLTKSLAVGAEFGNFEMADQDADSNYFQVSAKYTL